VKLFLSYIKEYLYLKIQKYTCEGWNILLNKIGLVLSILILGFIAGAFFSSEVRYAFSTDSEPVLSPSDHIQASDLYVLSDKAIIAQPNLIWAKVLDTHSMEPVLNSNSISLELAPLKVSQIEIGDIISYKQDSIVVIHRVIEINQDELGTYFITKGDNNPEVDPYKVRFEQVKGIVIGILY